MDLSNFKECLTWLLTYDETVSVERHRYLVSNSEYTLFKTALLRMAYYAT